MSGSGLVSETAEDDAPPLLDQEFGSGALHILRTEALALAGQAGLPDDRGAVLPGR